MFTNLTGLAFATYTTSASTNEVVAGPYQPSTWHRGAITSDGTTKRVYLDGVPGETFLPGPLLFDDADLQIGCDINAGASIPLSSAGSTSCVSTTGPSPPTSPHSQPTSNHAVRGLRSQARTTTLATSPPEGSVHGGRSPSGSTFDEGRDPPTKRELHPDEARARYRDLPRSQEPQAQSSSRALHVSRDGNYRSPRDRAHRRCRADPLKLALDPGIYRDPRSHKRSRARAPLTSGRWKLQISE